MIARSAGADLVTGEGLEAALAGVDAVIDATNVASTGKRVSSEFFEATARTLMRTAATAGVRHIVVLSIVGIDRVPYGYYQGKLRQEQVLQGSPPAPGGTSAGNPAGQRPARPSTGAWCRPSPQPRPQATWLR